MKQIRQFHLFHFVLFFFQKASFVIFFDKMLSGSLVFLVTIIVSVFNSITCVEPVVPLAQSQPIQQGTKLCIIIYIGRTKFVFHFELLFLAHLSRWLKVSYCDRSLSVVRPSVVRPSVFFSLNDISSGTTGPNFI